MSENVELLSHDWVHFNGYTFLNHVDIVILPAGTAGLRALPSTTTSIVFTGVAEITYSRSAAATSPSSVETYTSRANEIYQRFSEGGRQGYRNLAHDGRGDAVVFTTTLREQPTGTTTVNGNEIFTMNISYQYYRDRIDRDGASTIVLRVFTPIRRSFLAGVPTTGGYVKAATTFRTYV